MTCQLPHLNPLSPEKIRELAKQAGGTPYVNRHYPGETAVAFGPVALAEFVRLVRESAFAEAAQSCDEFETNLLHAGARTESGIAGACKVIIEDLK